MRASCCVLPLLLGVVAGCGGGTRATQPVTPALAGGSQDPAGQPAAGSSVTPTSNDTSTTDDHTEQCTPARGPIAVSFPSGYSTLELMTWYIDVTCHNVLMPYYTFHRRTRQAITQSISADQAAETLKTLLGHLHLDLVSHDKTVFVLDADDVGSGLGDAVLMILSGSDSGDQSPAGESDPSDPFHSSPDPETPPPDEEEETPSATSKAEFDAALSKGIRKVKDTHYVVKRELVDRILADPMLVARGARIVPSVKNGQPNGFKLYAIRPSSVYARIGLRNGDTIEKINDLELSSPDKALEVYTKLQGSKHLEISLIRRGKALTLVIDIE